MIWGLFTAAIGMIIIVLLVIDGVQYGIWVDEIGPSLDMDQQAAQPSSLTSALTALLAAGLVIGGLIVGATTPRGLQVDQLSKD
jgi:hypothetical protein